MVKKKGKECGRQDNRKTSLWASGTGGLGARVGCVERWLFALEAIDVEVSVVPFLRIACFCMFM